MDNQVPASNVPFPGVDPNQLAEMKRLAMEQAIQQYESQRLEMPQRPQMEPQVVYVKRNLTVAELGLIVLMAIGIVTGIQAGWNLLSNNLPVIEIKSRK